MIANGDFEGDEINDLVETFMGDLVGEGVFDKYGEQFPLLIKIIDANDWLSVQVHPDDELAEKREIGNGKTEMWYVMQADPGAELVSGFNCEMNRMKYIRLLKDNAIETVLNHESANQGDVFYIPAGRVHALGPGIVVAEIQQTSDTTYRIYDWDRMIHSMEMMSTKKVVKQSMQLFIMLTIQKASVYPFTILNHKWNSKKYQVTAVRTL